VHVPVEVPQQFIDMYAGRKFREDPANDNSFKRYAAYATHMDAAIGRIVDAVDRTGKRGDTLIIFVSDNGSFPGWKPSGKYPGRYEACPVLGSNLPFRGYKAQLYEGGIRVPTVANWPGILTPTDFSDPVHVVDWMPTLCRLAGYEHQELLKWDGRDIWPQLTGKVKKPVLRTFYWKFRKDGFALRQGDWKLIISAKNSYPELYNLATDPYEQSNLAEKHPAMVEQLTVLLAEHSKRDM
jgi:arylsulfatase A-like enzyme